MKMTFENQPQPQPQEQAQEKKLSEMTPAEQIQAIASEHMLTDDEASRFASLAVKVELDGLEAVLDALPNVESTKKLKRALEQYAEIGKDFERTAARQELGAENSIIALFREIEQSKLEEFLHIGELDDKLIAFQIVSIFHGDIFTEMVNMTADDPRPRSEQLLSAIYNASMDSQYLMKKKVKAEMIQNEDSLTNPENLQKLQKKYGYIELKQDTLNSLAESYSEIVRQNTASIDKLSIEAAANLFKSLSGQG
jgi:hypothetical protein